MNSLKPLYIIGAGGFGREVAWLVERINHISPTWDFKGFIDDDHNLWNIKVDGHKVYGGHSYLEKQETDLWTILAVGNAKVRKQVAKRIEAYSHIHFATLVDPDVQMSNRVQIGEGTIVCAGSIITTDIVIGSHNLINLDCTIGHDAVLENFVTLYPSVNISGAVKIGECTEIGVGTQIIQGLTIGSGVVIGASSGVFRDIGDGAIALGNPARVMKKNQM